MLACPAGWRFPLCFSDMLWIQLEPALSGVLFLFCSGFSDLVNIGLSLEGFLTLASLSTRVSHSFEPKLLAQKENDDFSVKRVFQKCLHNLQIENPFRAGICSLSVWAWGELATMATAA